MAKYDPLRDYLKKQRTDEFELSFAEMERKIGYMLPKSAIRPEWWSATAGCEGVLVQHKAWVDAGYDAVLIRGADRVRFKRVAGAEAST